ncbi:MAG: vitamin B12-dependent ribonucleotide reductase [SAR202 cluster bacterium]|nr:vitamin B12-dependent ribonucleotide reductase [SAR202 cluster bacterium]
MTATHQGPGTSAEIQERRRRISTALEAAGIAKQTNERSSQLTDNAKVVLERRYLSKDREGKILEDSDGMFRRVAVNLSQADLNYGATEEKRQATEDKFFMAMQRLELLPNSPTLMNAGRELQQLSACFVLPIEDNLGAIFDKVKQTALIHKSGGGTGFSFSRLRPEGDVVGSTGGIASGPVSFIRAFDAATDVVKQGGTRRGANMGILSVNHPDVEKFIKAKEDGVNLSNFNISVAVNADFMERAKAGQEYDLINPRTGKVVGQRNAKEIFDMLTHMAWKTGDPGLIFLDVINRDNPNPQLGEIESTNPCGEQPLLPHESCNLASINVARMVTIVDGDVAINWERLDETVNIAVHLLDNVIDMNNYPIPEIEEMSKKTRRIGLGVMGFSDLLIQLGIRYDSEEGLQTAEDVMRRIQEQTHQASSDLTLERGCFPAWEGSIYNRPGPDGSVKPMRNSAPTTIAPTGTISIIAGASSGIEPLFALSYVRNVMDNTKLVEGNPYFEAVARQEGFYSAELMEDLARTGSLEHLDIPQWVKEVFRVSHDISPDWHVKMQGAVQKYVDNSVSKTINFPNDATVQEIAGAYMLAYELGCKGITVYRDGSKSGQVLSTGGTGKKSEETDEINDVLAPRQRPQSIRGVTERVRTGHGNMYVTINFDESDAPFEVFGNLGKAGGCDSAQLEAISRLVSLALRSGIEAKTVIDQIRGITCCPAWDEGTMVRSGPDAVALALERHTSGAEHGHGESTEVQLKFAPQAVTNGNGNGNGHVKEILNARKCPDCNTPVIFEEGCMKCVACGWNKCE